MYEEPRSVFSLLMSECERKREERVRERDERAEELSVMAIVASMEPPCR